ncbi:MAG: hypothetical protein KF833_11185 [Verrucomicrobiae bacterium]|nr:hypothetical protein [Verrucomicrobiae bacterium]
MSIHLIRSGCCWTSLAAAMVVLGTGCQAPRQPLHLSAGFDARAVDRIVIPPVVDARPDSRIDINIDKWTRNQARRVLKQKRYTVELWDGQAGDTTYPEEELIDPSPQFIQSLGPEDARWIMIFSVHDVTRKLTFGSTGNAELAAILVDKQEGLLVWRDKAIGRAGQGGLIGMLVVGLVSQEAIQQATYKMIETIPKRPRR